MKIYSRPQTKVELAQGETMLAASKFDSNKGAQSIKPSDTEYNGEFGVKGYSFGDDFSD